MDKEMNITRYSGVFYGNQTPAQLQQGKGGGNSAPAPDPNIGLAAASNAATSAAALQLGREQLDWNKQQWAESLPYYKEIADAQLEQMKSSNARADDQWTNYKNLFSPLEEDYTEGVKQLNDAGYQEQQAGKSGAETANAIDASKDAGLRQLQRSGVNPNSGKYVGLSTGADLAKGAAVAGSENTTRDNTKLAGLSALQGAVQVGRGLSANSIAQDQASLQAGNSAQGNITGQATAYNAGIGSANPWFNTGVNANNSAGQLYLGQYNAQMDGYNAKQNANSGLGQAVGTGLGMWASSGFATKDGGLVGNGTVEPTSPIRYDDIDLRVSPMKMEGGDASIDPSDGRVIECTGKIGYADGGLVNASGIGGPIDTGRPMIDNPDGSFSTERTITIEADGKHILIPTIIGGKPYSSDQAIAAWKAGKNPAVGVFNSAEEAETAAVKRSKTIGQVRRPGYANGGLVRRPQYADGGMISGPGTTTSDDVPIVIGDVPIDASNKEAVLNAEAVGLVGEDFVRRINAAGLERRPQQGGQR